jgi:signal transduction histidine kinase
VTARVAAAILLLGVAGAVTATFFVDASTMESLTLGGLAGSASLGVGLAVAFLLWLLRRSSITTQMLLVTLGTVAAVAAGTFASAQTMFASEHPYAALTLVLLCSGTASALFGLSLSHRVREASEALAQAARNLGEAETAGAIDLPPTGELARLGRELELTAKRLEESRARADQLDASRRELVAWISHDLRTPLARIRAVVEALADGVVHDPQEVAGFYARLADETDRLSRLVDSLFELSRINAGALTLDLQPLELADVVSDLVASFAPLARARSIELQARRRASPVVDASMEHLERAISNLLDNAIRYGDTGSVVLVETGGDGSRAYVTITDSCGGFSGAELARILEEADVRRRPGRGTNGTGLGLAIAKGLVEAHGGAISADGNGDSCRFVVTLPRARR